MSVGGELLVQNLDYIYMFIKPLSNGKEYSNHMLNQLEEIMSIYLRSFLEENPLNFQQTIN